MAMTSPVQSFMRVSSGIAGSGWAWDTGVSNLAYTAHPVPVPGAVSLAGIGLATV